MVIFTHHYGGNSTSFRRHMDWVNELGFDVVTFSLPSPDIRHVDRLPIGRSLDDHLQFGLIHLWTDTISQVLSEVSGPKIMYSFSFPSAAALFAMNKIGFKDVAGWICDGGPFIYVKRGIRNLVIEKKLSGKIPQPVFTEVAYRLMTGFFYLDNIKNAVENIPADFPILSIRAESDRLVQPEMIAEFFSLGKNRLSIETLSVPKTEHLLGFKTEPEIYKARVGGFLEDRAKYE